MSKENEKMLKDTCEQALRVHCGVKKGMRILAAVSGGADSVALLFLLHALCGRMGFSLCAAHFNHCLRESAQRDEDFTRALCARLGIAFRAGKGDVRALSQARRRGMEDAAREARYAFLHATADEMNADLIALAHHMDDQAETVLLHAVRGCDVRGLCAMHARNGRLIRPLLGVEKSRLNDYLRTIDQSFCLDETNLSDEADRNKLRHGAMVSLSSINPRVNLSLARLAQSAQRDEEYFCAQLDSLSLDAFHAMPYGGFFSVTPLRELPDALRLRALERYLSGVGMAQITRQDILKADTLLREEAGRCQVSGGICLERARERLHVALPEREHAPCGETPVVLNGQTCLGAVTLLARKALPAETGDGVRTQVLDARFLQGAVLRTRREGDRFAPLGMRGTQKLKKTLIDAGVDRMLRPYVPLIACGSDVLWIIGLRPAATAAMTGQSQGIHFTLLGDLPHVQS